MTFGTDVSKFQGNINWETIPQEWAQFVYVRAKGSEGGRDEKFLENYWGAALSGRMVGSYGFARWREDPHEWANDWMDYAQPWSPLNLRPMLDVEAPHAPQEGNPPIIFAQRKVDRDYHDAMTPSQRYAWVAAAAEVVTERMAPPIIYTGANYWNSMLRPPTNSPLHQLPVCFARYSHVPGDLSYNGVVPKHPWADWTLHQFTSTHKLPGQGREQNVDRLFLNPSARLFDLVPALSSTPATSPQLPVAEIRENLQRALTLLEDHDG